jgi:cobalamin biosynthesis Mg chelatase CobN
MSSIIIFYIHSHQPKTIEAANDKNDPCIPSSLLLSLLPARMKSSTRSSATSKLISELSSGIRDIESECTVKETQYHEDDGSSSSSCNYKRSNGDNVSTSDNASASDNTSTSDNASTSEHTSTSGEFTSITNGRLAQKENLAVKYSKCLVYVVLLLAATGAGYFTFHFLNQEEKKDFEVQVS